MKTKTKLKIWTEQSKETHSEENCYLRLVLAESTDKAIILATVGEHGKKIKGGNILALDAFLGVVMTFDGLTPEVPLKTDVTDTVLVYSENELVQLRLQGNGGFDITEVMTRLFKQHTESLEPYKKTTIN